MNFMNRWFYLDAASEGEGSGDTTTTDNATDTSTVDTTQDTTTDTTDAKPDTNAIWPDDWRQKVAGDDAKELKRLERMSSPADVYKAYRALEARLSSGELKTALTKDARPEDVAKYRKENGIPETADKYDLKFSNNLVIGEEDKPIIDEFLKTAHSVNMTPQQASKAVEAYFEIQARNQERLAEKDQKDLLNAQDALNAEFGKEFRQNLNLVGSLLERFPKDVQEQLKSARLPDGTALFNNPDVVRGFVSMGLEINPTRTIVPAGESVNKGVIEEYQDLQKFMRTNRSEYNKDAGKQSRMNELIGWLAKNELIDSKGDVIVRKAA
jgi:hypothetical protein